MPEEIKNILPQPEGKPGDRPDDELLLKYINDQLTGEERHELEKRLLNDSFENDAVEGLQEIDQKEKIELIVDALNRDLKKRMAKKAKARNPMKLNPQWWFYFAILILLIILILMYVYLFKMLRGF